MKTERHKYEYRVDAQGDTAPARVVRMVGTNKRVLELGAGPGSITRLLCEPGNCRITALEIDASAIGKLAPYCESVHQADLNDPAWPELVRNEGGFEVIVAADVLEHVYEPQSVLAGMKSLLNGNGYLVVSLPHVGHSAIQACLFAEDFEYRDWGLLDRTHIRFFGIHNMQRLFDSAGMKIVAAEFVIRQAEETEFAERWSATPRALQEALAINPFGCVYQVVIKAVPQEAAGAPVALSAIPVGAGQSPVLPSAAASKFSDRLRAMARKHFHPDTRAAIRRSLARMGVRI